MSKVLGLLFWHEAHAKHVLTGCTNIHGQEVVHCLRVKSFSTEIGKRGDSLEALCGFNHGGLPAQNNGAGLDVTQNLEVSSKAAECEFDLVLQFTRKWDLDRKLATPESWIAGVRG